MNTEYILSNFSLEGRKAIVTGSAQGMGRSIAEALHAAGATVALIDYSASVRETALAIDAEGKTALPFVADLSDRSQIDRVFGEVMEAFGGPCVVIGGVNAATIPLCKPHPFAGYAVVSAIIAQPDIAAAARELRRIIAE